MTIGLAISTFNRPHILKLTLEYFLKYSLPETYICVVDDGSRDEFRIPNENICKPK